MRSVNICIGKDAIYVEVSPNTPRELIELGGLGLEYAGELDYFIHFADKPADKWVIIPSNMR